MKYLGAYMLAVLGGKATPSADDVKGILASCGIEADEDVLGRVMTAIGGKDVNELIAEGMTKLSAVPAGGAAAGGGAGGGAAPAEEEEKKEEAKEESEEEEEGDMDFDLFD